MDKHEKAILGFSGAAHFFAHFYMLLFPALLLPISRDLNIPMSQAVNISFTMYLLYGLLAGPWGFLSDRWSHKGVLSIGTGMAGLGMLLAGLGAQLGLGRPFLAVSFAVTGIGCSAYHPAGVAIVSQGIRERGRALGISGVFGNVGIATAPITAALLNYFFGWQAGLMILGGLGVLLGAASGFSPIGIEKGTDKLQVEKVEKSSAVKLFIVFAFALMFSGLMYRTFTTILPAYLELRLGSISKLLHSILGKGSSNPAFETLIANVVTTAIYVIGILGQLLGGRVSDTRSLKWGYFLFFLFALPFAGLMLVLKNFLLIPAAGLFVLFVLGIQPIENSLIAYLTPPKWRSLSYGIKFSLVFGVGSLAVKLVSLVQDRTGNITASMGLVAVFLCCIVLIISLFLFLSRGKEIKHQPAEKISDK